MKIFPRNFLILFILVIIFALPGIAAYQLYQHPQWLSRNTVNKGMLLKPPVLLKITAAKPKWRLIFWNPTSCKLGCLQQLDKLGRIRLALGRRLYEVDEWLLLDNRYQAQTEVLQKRLKNQAIEVLFLSDKQREQNLFAARPRIFIANPDNYIILTYELNSPPGDVFADLNYLLKLPEKKKD